MLKKIDNYFISTDQRGTVLGVLQKDVQEINYVESVAESVRGNHYHKDTWEWIFVIKGKIKVSSTNLETKEQSEIDLLPGDVLEIPPKELHVFNCLTDCKWINILSKKMIEPKDIHNENTFIGKK